MLLRAWCLLLDRDRRCAWPSRMRESALMASYAEVMAFYSAVWAVRDFGITEDILSDDHLNVLPDGGQDFFGPLGGVVDFIIHIIFAKIQIVERNEISACVFCTAPHFRTQEAWNVSFFPLLNFTNDWIGYEDGLLVCVYLQNLCQLFRLCLRFRLHLCKILARHILSRHDNDHLRIWQDRGVVVHVVCHVSYLGPGYSVESGVFCVRGKTKDRA